MFKPRQQLAGRRIIADMVYRTPIREIARGSILIIPLDFSMTSDALDTEMDQGLSACKADRLALDPVCFGHHSSEAAEP
jgi:hypothetical protein